MNRPIKILFIVMDFWQAGAQRFAYEVHLSLDKSKFDIDFLSYWNLNASKDFSDYYYYKHLELGSKIYFLNDLTKVDPPNAFKSRLVTNRISKRLLPKKLQQDLLSKANREDEKLKNFNSFLEGYDVIAWMGEYTVSHMHYYIQDHIFDKSIIHVMNAKFQGKTDYKDFSKNRPYTFTSGFDDSQQIEYEFSDFSNYKHIYFPLLLNINNKTNNWHFDPNNKKKKIGVFTRLDSMKPLDPFLYSFHLMLDTLPDIELHLFGAGDPAISGVGRIINHLGIGKNVFYRGHVESLIETAINERLDLVWFQGYKNRPGGYAGFDICLSGVPQLFWEFTYAEQDLDKSNLVYPIFKNINRFVKESLKILTDRETASNLSELQFNDTVQNKDIAKGISILEDLYVEVAGTSKKAQTSFNNKFYDTN